MLNTDLNVTAEIKLYYDVFVPEEANEPAPLLISVHGYGAHKYYMMREARVIAPENFAIASIQAPNQFFTEGKNGEYKVVYGWLTNTRSEEAIALHHKFVLDVIEKLVGEGIADEENIYLFGFSQACALNFRFAFTHPEILKGMIGVCGGIPSDLDTNEIYSPTDADILYLYGDKDEFYPLEKFQNFEKTLGEYLPNFQSLNYKAKHEITNEMREDMRKWMAIK
jgi:predicted esterase